MPSTTYPLDTSEAKITGSTPSSQPPEEPSLSLLLEFHGVRVLPVSWVPDQAYYWTPEWQVGESETLDSYAAGHGVEFASADDAIRWLLSGD